MQVALVTSFHASRKEPLAAVLERIHLAFVTSGLGEPATRFSFADAPLPGFVSSVERVLKRYPEMLRWTSTAPTSPTGPPVRLISNGPTSPASGESLEFSKVLAIAKGVPRSYPFHNLSIHFKSWAFGVALPIAGPMGSMEPGVVVSDSWWVNGRNRSVTAITSVDADSGTRKLPSAPDNVAAVLAACGKVKETTQIPLAETPRGSEMAAAAPNVAAAVSAVLIQYRDRFADVVDRANLPHDLPSAREALETVGLGRTTGPKKPVLVRAFKPMGYDCRGESGVFTLRRRTSSNLTVQIELDVGTWSRSLTASFSVMGLGFGTHLPLAVSKRAIGSRQYQIGDAENWQRIVENIAALVAELDRTYVPAIEAAAGPSPEWYQPQG
jgi:hypothetical protein